MLSIDELHSFHLPSTNSLEENTKPKKQKQNHRNLKEDIDIVKWNYEKCHAKCHLFAFLCRNLLQGRKIILWWYRVEIFWCL